MRKIVTCIIGYLLVIGAGYNGSLPNIEKEFEYKKNTPAMSSTPFNTQQTPNENNFELKPVPRENQKYLEIIIKKDKTSQYTNDTNTIITILEKLNVCLLTQSDIQKFNAIVSNLIDHISALQEQYKDKPESNYISYRSLSALSEQARKVAILRTESQVYTKYLPYSSSGSIYKPQQIQKELNSLSVSVEQVLYVLKNLD